MTSPEAVLTWEPLRVALFLCIAQNLLRQTTHHTIEDYRYTPLILLDRVLTQIMIDDSVADELRLEDFSDMQMINAGANPDEYKT